MPTAANSTATAAKAASRISVSRFVASESPTTDANVRTRSSGMDESSLDTTDRAARTAAAGSPPARIANDTRWAPF
jgi:hypothetical protein